MERARVGGARRGVSAASDDRPPAVHEFLPGPYPGWELGKPFAYVGMTGLDPDVRFDKHKAGIQANSFVREYGLRLLPAVYEKFNPLRYEEARTMEVELGIALRAKGWGVWQA